MILISKFIKEKAMVKVYMFIYAMIIFFSNFISITSATCRNNMDCQHHLCVEAGDIPICIFWVTEPDFLRTEFGICACVGKVTAHKISG
ncbi:unnamed protein product [Trifolium pratense]|uniref:Uncharacterized protein n=1 Tax=Trifolium pratense TaxID=57577 RepID=A0ACB0LA38_TRIPR|nr:unnamed protein product [Trifolium pratense]